MFNRKDQRQKRHLRLRQRVVGTAERPRMSICVTEVAKALGARAAEAAKAVGISTVVVDRGGFKYTGRVAAIVESAVEAGLSVSAKKEDK